MYMDELRAQSGSIKREDRLTSAPKEGELVKFSSYYDPYAGDYTTSDIQGGMIGTVKGSDTSRDNHFIVQLGDHTNVSVALQQLSFLKR